MEEIIAIIEDIDEWEALKYFLCKNEQYLGGNKPVIIKVTMKFLLFSKIMKIYQKIIQKRKMKEFPSVENLCQ